MLDKIYKGSHKAKNRTQILNLPRFLKSAANNVVRLTAGSTTQGLMPDHAMKQDHSPPQQIIPGWTRDSAALGKHSPPDSRQHYLHVRRKSGTFSNAFKKFKTKYFTTEANTKVIVSEKKSHHCKLITASPRRVRRARWAEQPHYYAFSLPQTWRIPGFGRETTSFFISVAGTSCGENPHHNAVAVPQHARLTHRARKFTKRQTMGCFNPKKRQTLVQREKSPSKIIVRSLAINVRTSKVMLASTKPTGSHDD